MVATAEGGRILHLVPDPLLGFPLLLVVGWVVRVPLLSPQEGHEAITRASWDGLGLTDAQRAALIRGVRAPDISIRGLAVFAFPSRQRRHALRAHASTSTAEGVSAMREFFVARHRGALEMADDGRLWEALGEILHCIQDSYSPAHADREGARVLRMKHWGPFDRRRHADEHGFPTDVRDHAVVDGALTDAARTAASTCHRYLELALRQTHADDRPADVFDGELTTFMDGWASFRGD
jgi:hypothetical protein